MLVDKYMSLWGNKNQPHLRRGEAGRANYLIDKSDLTARSAGLSLDTTALFLNRCGNFVKKFKLVEL